MWHRLEGMMRSVRGPRLNHLQHVPAIRSDVDEFESAVSQKPSMTWR
jgi:hypothetical protein